MISKTKLHRFVFSGMIVVVAVLSLYFFYSESFSQSQTIEETVKSGSLIEHDGFLYVLNGDLAIYDLQNPALPSEVSRTNGPTGTLHIVDNWLLVSEPNELTLTVYDINDPTQIIEEATFTGRSKFPADVTFAENNIWYSGGVVSLSETSDNTYTEVIPTPIDEFNSIEYAQIGDLLWTKIDKEICSGGIGGFFCSGPIPEIVFDISEISNPVTLLERNLFDPTTGEILSLGELRLHGDNSIFLYEKNDLTGLYDATAYQFNAGQPLNEVARFGNVITTFPNVDTKDYFYMPGFTGDLFGWYKSDSSFIPPTKQSDNFGLPVSELTGFSIDSDAKAITNKQEGSLGVGYPAPERNPTTEYAIRDFPNMCQVSQKHFDGATNAELLDGNQLFTVLDAGGGEKSLLISEINNATVIAKKSEMHLFYGVTVIGGRPSRGMGSLDIYKTDDNFLYLLYRDTILVTIDVSDVTAPVLSDYRVTRALSEDEAEFFEGIIASFEAGPPEMISLVTSLFKPFLATGPNLLFENTFEEIDFGTTYESPETGEDFGFYCWASEEMNVCPSQVDDGVRGKAAYFNGEYDRLGLGQPESLTELGAPFAVSAWLKPSSTDGLRNLVSRGHVFAPAHEMIFRIQDGNYEFGLWDGNDQDQLATYPVPEWNSENWSHLVGVYTGSAWNLYFNGDLVDSTTDNAGDMACNTANWAIGKSGNFDERFYHGHMDELKFFIGPVSDRQVKQLYENR